MQERVKDMIMTYEIAKGYTSRKCDKHHKVIDCYISTDIIFISKYNQTEVCFWTQRTETYKVLFDVLTWITLT